MARETHEELEPSDEDRAVPGTRSRLLNSLAELGWPLFWGLAAWVGFYALLKQGVLRHEMLQRYFAGHPVEYVEAALFFIGMAALGRKLMDVGMQWFHLGRPLLEAIPAGGQPIDEAPDMLAELAEQPSATGGSYLVSRLRDTLERVRRTGSAEQVDQELKYLAETDADRAHESYALVRMIVWATPMLGFLGTVIGITVALGGLSPEALVNTPKVAMEGLLAGLAVAFDTTALAISLSIFLMFSQFVVHQVESQLLAAVDRQVADELIGRFQVVGGAHDPHVASLQQVAQQVVRSSETLVERQASIWKETIDQAHQTWSQLVSSSGVQVQQSLNDALSSSLNDHADKLSAASETTAELSHRLWERLQAALAENAKLVEKQQQEMVRQGEMLGKMVDASGGVMQLEQTLNSNLQSLAGAHHFEETVTSLAAAVQLLGARMGRDGERVVDLRDRPAQDRAA